MSSKFWLAPLLAGLIFFAFTPAPPEPGKETSSRIPAGLPAVPADILPAARAFAGFRGLAAALIWLEAAAARADGDFQTLGWHYLLLSRLQPRQEEAWIFRGWDMATNLAGMGSDAEEAGARFWRGLNHLRLDGMAALPESGNLALRTADLLAIGMAGETRTARREKLKREMEEALGGDAPPEAQAKTIAILAADSERNQAVRLRHLTGLDPGRMLELNRRFGLFDWRLASSQELYWAWLARRLHSRRDSPALAATLLGAMRAVSHDDAAEGNAPRRFGMSLTHLLPDGYENPSYRLVKEKGDGQTGNGAAAEAENQFP